MHDDDVFDEVLNGLGGKPWENNLELHEFTPRAAVSIWEGDIVVWFGTVANATTDSGGFSGEIAVGRSADGRRVTELDPESLDIQFVSLVLPTSMFAGELAFDIWEFWAHHNALKMAGWLDRIPEETLRAEIIEKLREWIASGEAQRSARGARAAAGSKSESAALDFVRALGWQDFLNVLALLRNHLRRTAV